MDLLKFAALLSVALTCALAHPYQRTADGTGSNSAPARVFLAQAPMAEDHGHHHEKEPHHYPKYEFKYGVKDDHTGDIKEHHESRDGDVVKGMYSLIEPDGTTRIVHYTVDGKSGFNAVVTKEGHPTHPVAAPVKHVKRPAIEHAPATVAPGRVAPKMPEHIQPVYDYSSSSLSQGQAAQAQYQPITYGYSSGQGQEQETEQGQGYEVSE